jgi:hypothetical protein
MSITGRRRCIAIPYEMIAASHMPDVYMEIGVVLLDCNASVNQKYECLL